MALAAGFGLNFENCDPAVFEQVEEILADRAKESKRQQMEDELRAKMR